MSRAWKSPNRNLPGWLGYQPPDRSKPSKLPFCAKPNPQAILLATKENRKYDALYVRHGQKWKLIRAHPALDFLRCCGPQDAPRALEKRGFTFAWSTQNRSRTPFLPQLVRAG